MQIGGSCFWHVLHMCESVKNPIVILCHWQRALVCRMCKMLRNVSSRHGGSFFSCLSFEHRFACLQSLACLCISHDPHIPWLLVSSLYSLNVEDIFSSPQLAQCECLSLGHECKGITCEKESQSTADASASCTLRRGDPWLTKSPSGEASYVKVCESGGCDSDDILRIVHVNFADGCCEAEQNQSSTTALQFGANESRQRSWGWYVRSNLFEC